MVTLTDYQTRSYQIWKDNGYRGLIQGFTGCGKTLLGCYCIWKFKEDVPNAKVIVITTNQTSVLHWLRDLASFGIDDVEVYTYGQAINKMFRPPSKEYTYKGGFETTIELQYINRETPTPILRGLSCDLMVSDECHHLANEGHGKVMEMKPFFILGLSATPGDSVKILGKPLDKITADESRVCPFTIHLVSFDPTIEEMEDYITATKRMKRRARIFSGGKECPKCWGEGGRTDIKNENGSYADHPEFVMCEKCKGEGYIGGRNSLRPREDAEGWDSYDSLVRRRRDVCYTFESRIPLAVKIAKKHKGERTVIFTERTIHAHQIADALMAEGLPCSMNVNDKDTMKDFELGKTNILVMVKSLREAWDDPSLSVLIMASLTTKERLMTQTMGRTMRVDPNNPKKHAHNYLLLANGTSDHYIKGNLDYPKNRFTEDTADTLFAPKLEDYA